VSILVSIFPLETGSATLYHSACPASFGADNLGHAGVYQLTEPRGAVIISPPPEPPPSARQWRTHIRPHSAGFCTTSGLSKWEIRLFGGHKLNTRVRAEPLVFEYQSFLTPENRGRRTGGGSRSVAANAIAVPDGSATADTHHGGHRAAPIIQQQGSWRGATEASTRSTSAQGRIRTKQVSIVSWTNAYAGCVPDRFARGWRLRVERIRPRSFDATFPPSIRRCAGRVHTASP